MIVRHELKYVMENTKISGSASAKLIEGYRFWALRNQLSITKTFLNSKSRFLIEPTINRNPKHGWKYDYSA